jgi:glutamyl-Q tRNA(Asp) synthetase
MIVTRFAPSPTGYLHLGHAYAAGFAATAGETFLLRLEDIDTTRCRPQFAAAIIEDVRWLGLRFPEPVLRQSSRLAAYRAALAALLARGLVYPCFCTRKDIAQAASAPHLAPHGPDGPGGPRYPGTCKHLSAEERARRTATEPYALRLDAQAAAEAVGDLSFEETGLGPDGQCGKIAVDPHLFGDVVLARKDAFAAYHLAVVLDDAFQGVSLVTRGADLFAATHIQRVLQALLNLPVPAYRHHKLILDEHGRKFSKRDRAVTLRALRAAGVSVAQIHRRLGL